MGNHPRRRFKTPTQWDWVFLTGGGGKTLADHLRSLLTRAGDVEKNPGPCHVCGRAVRTNNRPMKCGGCQREAHGACTGLKRKEREDKTTKYMCCTCRGIPGTAEERPAVEERGTAGGGRCVVCRRALRSGAPVVRCRGCTGGAHRTCSGLRRRRREEVDDRWMCPDCGGGNEENNPEENPPQQRTTAADPQQPALTSENINCPECQRKLATTQTPLICSTCRRRYHFKCAKETRGALEVMRRSNTWRCHQCIDYETPAPENRQEETKTRVGGGATKRRGLTILQWNCDFLATKMDELRQLAEREGADVMMIQETKLGAKDRTPEIPGYTSIRRDRRGSGAVLHRGGGLMTYVRADVGYEEKRCEVNNSKVEAQKISIHTEEENLNLTNIYIPPIRGEEARRQTDQIIKDLTELSVGSNEVWCGDFNAHHPMWDTMVPPDVRGEAIDSLLNDRGLITINDGRPTRYSRAEGGEGCSSPDLTVVKGENYGQFTWEPLHELQSDHLPIKITWSRTIVVERKQRKTELNVRKTDWEEYKRYIDERAVIIDEETNIPEKYKKLVETMKEAAKKATPIKVKRKDGIHWETSEIRKAKKCRNRLRRDLTARREEWVQKSREVGRLIREAKTRVWREKLRNIQESKDTTKAWDLVKGLSGARSVEKKNEALEYKGRVCTTNRAKANAFCQHYAEISGKRKERARAKELRREAVLVAREVRAEGPPSAVESEFTMGELTAALNKIKPRKAAGPDELKSDFVARMPATAKKIFLQVCNYSWRNSWLPQAWRSALIIPILKKGKSPALVGSYRPIALTDHLGKALERMINARLSWWLEEKGALSEWQSGFRRGRSTTDQCLRLSQRVSDGFQRKPPERTVLTLFDYTKAFDTVWRTGLLRKMLDKGIPATFIRWTKAWLVNRMAKTVIGEDHSRARIFKEGLPQGAVLSPLLFSIFIDDLLSQFDRSTLVSAFADDLALACSDKDKEVASTNMQAEIERVVEWSERWGLQLNGNKCEATLFTTDSSESKWKPQLSMRGKTLGTTKSPVFLGVKYDPRLTFTAHVEDIATKMEERGRILRAIGGADWGWTKGDMCRVYTATQRSVAEYAAPAWSPWTSATNKEKLERRQRGAARSIAGLTKSTPMEAIEREVKLETIEARHRKASLIKYDRWMRMEETDPRKRVAIEAVPARTKKKDWRGECRETMATMGDLVETLEAAAPGEDEEPEARSKPWRRGTPCQVRFAETRKTDTVEEQQVRAVECVEGDGPTDIVVYTDGAASGGTRRGGAGVVIYRGEAEVTRWAVAAGEYCSSYSAETVAAQEAMRWLEGDPGWETATLVTDSRSLVEALQGDANQPETRKLQSALWRLHDRGRNLKICWVPGHCGLPGNEEADKMAAEGTTMTQEGVAICGSAREAAIKRRLKTEKPLQHPALREVYVTGVKEEEEGEQLTRKQRVNLARFRTGHHTKLRRWQHMVGLANTAECRLCGAGEESAKHIWTECPELEDLRRRFNLGETMGELTESPVPAEALLSKILRRLGE